MSVSDDAMKMVYEYFDNKCYWHDNVQDMNITNEYCNCSKTKYDYDPVCENCKYYISVGDVRKLVEDYQAKKK